MCIQIVYVEISSVVVVFEHILMQKNKINLLFSALEQTANWCCITAEPKPGARYPFHLKLEFVHYDTFHRSLYIIMCAH